MAKKNLDAIVKKFGKKIADSSSDHGEEVIHVAGKDLLEVAQFLRDDPAMAYDSPVFVTAIDNIGQKPRFQVCFQLRSVKHRHRLRIKVAADGDKPKVPSLCGLWPGFEWQERETFDMYGIEFEGHPDLRRIYLYDEFEGYPLRKDYPKDKRQPLVRREYNE
jgi:NADH-quinone oxidoreductase subunit C